MNCKTVRQAVPVKLNILGFVLPDSSGTKTVGELAIFIVSTTDFTRYNTTSC